MLVRSYDVVTLGSAMVDTVACVTEEFIVDHDLQKGGMNIIDRESVGTLKKLMNPQLAIGGGAAANTAVGVASLGGSSALIASIGSDALGQLFTEDLSAFNVHRQALVTKVSIPTSECIVLVTADTQRTLCTYLGASSSLTTEDIDTNLLQRSMIIYIEGHMWNLESYREVVKKAVEIGYEYGCKISFSLPDHALVESYSYELREYLEEYVDILFGNVYEVRLLYMSSNIDELLPLLRSRFEIAVVTQGAAGSMVISPKATYRIPAHNVVSAIDTTGAGDFFAAGFLFAYAHDWDLGKCGLLGSICASEIVSHYGTRPQIELKTLV